MAYKVTIYDQRDGTGIGAIVQGTDPAAVNTAYIQDATQPGVWRQADQITGNGTLLIGVGEAESQVVLARSYWVRVDTLTGLVLNTGTPFLVTPSRGYKSYAFEMLSQAAQTIIALNIAEVGGRVFVCLDPRAVKVIPELPAVFLFQASGETYSPADYSASFVDLPLACQIADRLEADWVERTEWWLYARQMILDHFNRVNTELFGVTGSGRRWRVEPGALLMPDDEQAYLYRASLITLHADLERPIGGE